MNSVTLLVNGPGELWGWCRPLTRELKRRNKNVTIWILPCQFASGREGHAAMALGADEVKGPYSSANTLRAMNHHETDGIIQLGGDLFFGRHMGQKGKVPLFCYTYGRKKGLEHCSGVFTAFESMARSISPNAAVVGDLVKEGILMDDGPSPWLDRQGLKLVLFPGSRPAIRAKALPYLMEVVSLLREQTGPLQVATLLSPFSKAEERETWCSAGLNPAMAGTGVVLKNADMALTQPGTNTLELMHMGIPALVAVPFAFLREIPISGLKGLIASLPVFGPAVKEKVLRWKANHRTSYLAWPNRLSQSQIMKEVVGELSSKDVVREISALWFDHEERRAQKIKLCQLSGRSIETPSKKLCDMIERLCSNE